MFKVGDKVYDSVNFPGIEGVVVEVDGQPRPYHARFGVIGHWYYVGGAFCLGSAPTLSHEPYDPPRVVIHKEPQFKVGDKVLVRDEDTGKWWPSIYRRFEKDDLYQHCTPDGRFKQCIPFDIDLLNTAKTPII